MNKLTEALKLIRKELLIMDEPLKAFNLLVRFNDEADIIRELENTYGMIRHAFEPEIYRKYYGMHGEDQIPDCEDIEPRNLIKNAGIRYPRYQWIVDELKANKPKTYLDLACYVGSLVTTASSMGVKACGVDMTKRAIEIARNRAESENLDCKFYCDDATTFDKFKADMVSAFEVIEHVPNPEKFIKHLLKLSDGWVYITTPNGSYDKGMGNIDNWEWDGVETHVRGHLRVFTKQSMFKLLDSCGCEIGFLEAMGDNLLWAKFRRKEG